MALSIDHIHHGLEVLQEKLTQDVPDVAVILGSGMGGFTDELSGAKSVSYSELPYFPRPGVQGHKGECHFGSIGNRKVLVFSGRSHFYEGHAMDVVTLPARICGAWKIKNLVVTNASGGIRKDLTPGSFVFIKDHINFTGSNPLRGPNLIELGDRFVDMTEAYDPGFRDHGLRVSKHLGIEAKDGVYIAVAGPCYETPAEIRAFENIGADLVGMSTVPEVIVARHQKMKVLGLSLVVNTAAGLSKTPGPIEHGEVLQKSKEVEKDFCRLLSEWIKTVEL